MWAATPAGTSKNVNCLVAGSKRMTWLAAIEASHTVLFGCTRMVLPLALPLVVGGRLKDWNCSVFGSKLSQRRLGPPSTIQNSPWLPRRMALRRTLAEAAGGGAYSM